MHSNGATIDENRLQRMPLFSDLSAESIAAIAGGGWMVRHNRGNRIISRGEHLDGLYTVFDGRLKLYMLSCGGDERVLRILQTGDTFGEAIMFNGIPSPVFVETISPVQLAYFPREVISGALEAHPDFTRSMLRGMSMLMRELIGDLEACCLQSARQRTVSYLLREALVDDLAGERVQLPAAKAVVASTLNISAETFSRELHRLQDLDLIEIEKRIIWLRDREGLEAIIEGGVLPLATD